MCDWCGYLRDTPNHEFGCPMGQLEQLLERVDRAISELTQARTDVMDVMEALRKRKTDG